MEHGVEECGAKGYGAEGYGAEGYGAEGYGAEGYGAEGYGAEGYGVVDGAEAELIGFETERRREAPAQGHLFSPNFPRGHVVSGVGFSHCTRGPTISLQYSSSKQKEGW